MDYLDFCVSNTDFGESLVNVCHAISVVSDALVTLRSFWSRDLCGCRRPLSQNGLTARPASLTRLQPLYPAHLAGAGYLMEWMLSVYMQNIHSFETGRARASYLKLLAPCWLLPHHHFFVFFLEQILHQVSRTGHRLTESTFFYKLLPYKAGTHHPCPVNLTTHETGLQSRMRAACDS